MNVPFRDFRSVTRHLHTTGPKLQTVGVLSLLQYEQVGGAQITVLLTPTCMQCPCRLHSCSCRPTAGSAFWTSALGLQVRTMCSQACSAHDGLRPLYRISSRACCPDTVG